ncbi:hypothetical protein [Clostridium sp.]|uniref:hypothetical protein n=1 Tax=Clostridium sp. TaxID=1506 RepID=UPI00399341A3
MINKCVKKVIAVSVAVLTAGVMLYGCAGETSSPKTVVNDYFKGISKGDDKKVTELLSEAPVDFNQGLVESFDENIKKAQKIVIDNFKKITWTTGEEKIEGDKATVDVKVKGPNMMKALESYISKALEEGLKAAFSGEEITTEKTEEMVNKMLVEAMGKMEIDEREGKISLIKKEGQWKIEQNSELIKVILGEMTSLK